MVDGGESPGAVAARLTGRPVSGERAGPGGLAEVTLAGGPAVVVKRGDGPGAVRAEAAGLRWLAAARAVPVPEVLGHDE
ncbi:fructosamine kinase, partial [Streptomyces sp900105755]